jgi:hypothetical protein
VRRGGYFTPGPGLTVSRGPLAWRGIHLRSERAKIGSRRLSFTARRSGRSGCAPG